MLAFLYVLPFIIGSSLVLRDAFSTPQKFCLRSDRRVSIIQAKEGEAVFEQDAFQKRLIEKLTEIGQV